MILLYKAQKQVNQEKTLHYFVKDAYTFQVGHPKGCKVGVTENIVATYKHHQHVKRRFPGVVLLDNQSIQEGKLTLNLRLISIRSLCDLLVHRLIVVAHTSNDRLFVRCFSFEEFVFNTISHVSPSKLVVLEFLNLILK